jgi:hypothetical protein
MRKKVTMKEMRSEVMKSAMMRFRMSGRYAWVKENTWSECLRAAWECAKLRYYVPKKEKPVKVEARRCLPYSEIDLSFLYGNGRYNGD